MFAKLLRRIIFKKDFQRQFNELSFDIDKENSQIDVLTDYHQVLFNLENQINNNFSKLNKHLTRVLSKNDTNQEEIKNIQSQIENEIENLKTKSHIDKKQKKVIKNKFDLYIEELNKIKRFFSQIELDIFTMESDLREIISQAKQIDTKLETDENSTHIEELINRFNEVMHQKNLFQEKINSLNFIGKSLE